MPKEPLQKTHPLWLIYHRGEKEIAEPKLIWEMQRKHTEAFLSPHLQAVERLWHTWVSVGSQPSRHTKQHPLPSPLPEDSERRVFKGLSPVLPTTGIILLGTFGASICWLINHLSSLLPQLNAYKRAFLLLLHFSFKIKLCDSQYVVLLVKVILSRSHRNQYQLKLLNSCRSRKISCFQIC